MAKKKRKPQRRDADMAFLWAAGKFLRRRGWNALVIGTKGVSKIGESRYQFVLEFIGAELIKKPKPRQKGA